MANLFDDANAPETEPATIVAVMSVGEAAEAVGKGLADYAERSLASRRVNQGAPHQRRRREPRTVGSLAESERLRFYEDAAKVVQRRMGPNFKKSFDRAVRTARR